MVVSEQIDAMRALGTDPVRKLVAPRILALIITLPLWHSISYSRSCRSIYGR